MSQKDCPVYKFEPDACCGRGCYVRHTPAPAVPEPPSPADEAESSLADASPVVAGRLAREEPKPTCAVTHD